MTWKEAHADNCPCPGCRKEFDDTTICRRLDRIIELLERLDERIIELLGTSCLGNNPYHVDRNYCGGNRNL